MTWILLGILLILVLVVAGVTATSADRTRWTARSLTRRRRDQTPGMRLPAPRCRR